MYTEFGIQETAMRKIRKPLMTLQKLADLTKISPSRLGEIENQKSYIYKDEILLIAKLLNVGPEELSEGLLIWNRGLKKPPFAKRK